MNSNSDEIELISDSMLEAVCQQTFHTDWDAGHPEDREIHLEFVREILEVGVPVILMQLAGKIILQYQRLLGDVADGRVTDSYRLGRHNAILEAVNHILEAIYPILDASEKR